MYVVENHNKQIAEALAPENLRGTIDDLPQIMRNNEVYREVMDAKDAGRPGHYWGRDMVIEGAMPMAAFLMTKHEFGGDEDWYRDDRKFQDFMKRNPGYSWLNRR